MGKFYKTDLIEKIIVVHHDGSKKRILIIRHSPEKIRYEVRLQFGGFDEMLRF